MEVAECYRAERPGERGANAQHIASWDPAVALTVADWLDEEAAACDEITAQGYTPSPGKALAVARAFMAVR
jgi:hypothetical protein